MITLELLKDYRNQFNEIEKDYNTLTDSGKSNRKSLNSLYSRAHKIYIDLLWDNKLALEPNIAIRKEELMRDLSRFLESISIDLKWFQEEVREEDLTESKEPLTERVMNNQQIKDILTTGSSVSIKEEGIKLFRDWVNKQSYSIREVREAMSQLIGEITVNNRILFGGNNKDIIMSEIMMWDSRKYPDKDIFFAEDLGLIMSPSEEKYRILERQFKEKAKTFLNNTGVSAFNLKEEDIYYVPDSELGDLRMKATYVLLYTILEQIMLFDKENPGYIVVEDMSWYEPEDDYPLDEQLKGKNMKNKQLKENREDLKKDNDKQILLEIDDMLDDLEDDGEISNMSYLDSNQILLKALDAVKNGTDGVYKYEPEIKEAFDIVKETYNLAKEGFRQFDYNPAEIDVDAYDEYFSEEEQFYESLKRLGITFEDLIENNNILDKPSSIANLAFLHTGSYQGLAKDVYFNDMWNILQGVEIYLHYNYPDYIVE